MTPDMYPKYFVQLMKESMIVAAPLFDCGGASEFPAQPGSDLDQLAGAVVDLGSAPGRNLHDPAGRHALVPGQAGRLHILLMTDFTGFWDEEQLFASRF